MTTVTVKKSRKAVTPAALEKAAKKAAELQAVAEREAAAKAEAERVEQARRNPKIDAIGEACPIKTRMLDQALGKMASRNKGKSLDEVKDFATDLVGLGVEQLSAALIILGQEDQMTTMSTIRKLVRQLTRDTYNRFDGIRKQQEQAARGNRDGGNGNGHFLTTEEIIRHATFKLDGETGRSQVILREDEDGVHMVTMNEEFHPEDPGYCTPAAQLAALEEMYIPLATIFLTLEQVEFSWREDFSSNGLPYYSWQSTDGVWHECITFEEAADRMALERADFIEEKKSKKRNAIAALRDMDLSRLAAKTRNAA